MRDDLDDLASEGRYLIDYNIPNDVVVYAEIVMD